MLLDESHGFAFLTGQKLILHFLFCQRLDIEGKPKRRGLIHCFPFTARGTTTVRTYSKLVTHIDRFSKS